MLTPKTKTFNFPITLYFNQFIRISSKVHTNLKISENKTNSDSMWSEISSLAF